MVLLSFLFILFWQQISHHRVFVFVFEKCRWLQISFSIVVTAENATDARQDAATSANATFEVLIPLVGRGNIATTGITLYPNYVYDEELNRSVIDGYTFSQSVLVRVTNVTEGSTLGNVIDKAIQAGGNALQVNNVNIKLSPEVEREAMSQARTIAVKDAILTAETLANAANVTAGEVLSIVDNYALSAPPSPMRIGESDAVGQATPTPVVISDQEVTAWVTMQLAINGA